jgi:hypothetical protein
MQFYQESFCTGYKKIVASLNKINYWEGNLFCPYLAWNHCKI